jgi:hypothetical protein
MVIKIETTTSDDINERLRDKTMQIVTLNQKLEAMRAQIGGSQRRANQLDIEELQYMIKDWRIRVNSMG